MGGGLGPRLSCEGRPPHIREGRPPRTPEHEPHVVLLLFCLVVEGELSIGRDDGYLPQVPAQV